MGVASMLWLARKLSRAGQLPGGRQPPDVTFWQGVGLQFVNIKARMLASRSSWRAGWSNAAGQPATNRVTPGHHRCVMVAFAFSNNFVYALLGSLLRQWLSQGARLLWFNRALALVLVATAVWMLTL